jgi:hypothetical protein
MVVVKGLVGMVEVDFTDREVARSKLKTRSVEAHCFISSRAALRVLANISADAGYLDANLTLACLRATLTAAGRGYGRITGVTWEALFFETTAKSTANASQLTANSAARSAARAANLAANSALFPANSANSARSTVLSAATSVALSENSARRKVARVAALSAASLDFDEKLELLTTSAEIPIWDRSVIPAKMLRNHLGFLNYLDSDPKWSFWRDWYQAIWNGTFNEWELAAEVIIIPTHFWEGNNAAYNIATEIELIKAKLFTRDHPLIETTDINPETGLFFSTPVSIQNTQLIGALLSQVQDGLEDATLGNNGLNEASRETRVLTRTLTRYANDPQRIEMDFTSVAVGLRRQIHDTAELPNSEDNLALLEAVEDGVRGIRAAHPDVAQNRLILAQQSLRELSADHVELLEDAKPVLVAISEDIMAEDFAADIPSLINDSLLPLPNGAPALPGADAATRVFNRVSHMRLMYDQFVEGGSKAFDSNLIVRRSKLRGWG